ncbi:phosphatase PAP2 family protein [Hymenobacter busanensis]|uniref:Phosphatase PAP2 family protein n=1 Tax=Hymenobacter busanensis TaxID=2607656 RepID=A0A7L4ZYB3_9BACT|nr:phosphatase PAP2 family protein [Hymenobacter busanensis]KAA9332440.1 phosphatase PAP2 family protein [Hymenobacter busanensis]QHJ07222.1 phosphatase PAP2 family protein [Hymenobacter busanensis]
MLTAHVRRLLAGVVLFVTEFALILLVGTVGVVVFLALGRQVLGDGQVDFDEAAFSWSHWFLGENNRRWVDFMTFMASRNFIIVAALSIIGYFLLIRKHRWYSLKVPVVALGSITLNLLLKNFYNRPRPQLPLTSASGLSFPSGHAMISASFYGLLIYLTWQHVENRSLRWLLTVLLSALILLIGLTRVYLRVHYASDVLAGFAAGLLWLLVALPLLKRIELFTKRRVRPGVPNEASAGSPGKI